MLQDLPLWEKICIFNACLAPWESEEEGCNSLTKE